MFVNRTLLTALYVPFPINDVIDKVYPLLCGTAYITIAFVVTLVCTVYLIVHLSRASRWRLKHSNTTATSADTSDVTCKTKDAAAAESAVKKKEKNERAVRTVVAITVVFIVCFLPGLITMALYSILPGLTLYGRYGQAFQLLQATVMLCEVVNSSINLFIYYTMGSSYRAMFHQVTKCLKLKQSGKVSA